MVWCTLFTKFDFLATLDHLNEMLLLLFIIIIIDYYYYYWAYLFRVEIQHSFDKKFTNVQQLPFLCHFSKVM